MSANDRWTALCNQEWSRTGLNRVNAAHRRIVWEWVARQLSDEDLGKVELLPPAMRVVHTELARREGERWWT